MESSGKYWIPVFNNLEKSCCVTLAHPKYTKLHVFGKSARSITNYMLEHPGEHFDAAPFVDRRCKHPFEEIQAAVDGPISQEQSVKLREVLRHIDEIQTHKRNIETEILSLVALYQMLLALMRTVPGFSSDPMTAVTVLSEIGGDMSVFPTAKNFSSWAGCALATTKAAVNVSLPVSLEPALVSNRSWCRWPIPLSKLFQTYSLSCRFCAVLPYFFCAKLNSALNDAAAPSNEKTSRSHGLVPRRPSRNLPKNTPIITHEAIVIPI